MSLFHARRSPRPRALALWSEAFAEAVEELAPEALGFDMAGITSYRPDPAAGSAGAVVPLNGDSESLQFGLFAAPEALRALAAARLGRDESSVEHADVIDGITDLLELLVGAVEARLFAAEGSSRGVPLFVTADGLRHAPSEERAGMQMLIGPAEVTLVVVRRVN